MGTTPGFVLGQEPLSELRCQLSEVSLAESLSLPLQVFSEISLPSEGCISLGQEASFRMVASWWEVLNSVNNSLAKTYAVEKYQIYGVEEKEKTQISAGFAKNE